MAESRTYQALTEALLAAAVPIGLAELHGGFCGALCAGGDDAARRWIAQSLAGSTASAADAKRLQEQLEVLGRGASRALSDFELGFEPCLPDDDEPLAARVLALASWCQGFLAGLGVGGLGEAAGAHGHLGDVEEIIRDFAEIGKAEMSAEEAGAPREAGFAFAQLAEYVRVGVQVVYEELGERRRAGRGARSADRTAH